MEPLITPVLRSGSKEQDGGGRIELLLPTPASTPQRRTRDAFDVVPNGATVVDDTFSRVRTTVLGGVDNQEG